VPCAPRQLHSGFDCCRSHRSLEIGDGIHISALFKLPEGVETTVSLIATSPSHRLQPPCRAEERRHALAMTTLPKKQRQADGQNKPLAIFVEVRLHVAHRRHLEIPASIARNRHNCRFMAADAIARPIRFPDFEKNSGVEIAEGHMGRRKNTASSNPYFITCQDDSVRRALRVLQNSGLQTSSSFHDELDLAPGKLKLKVERRQWRQRPSNHHAHCGKDYKALRSHRHPGHKRRVNPHVLGDFAKFRCRNGLCRC